MANLNATYSSDFHAVFVETSLETRIAILAHKMESISDFRDKFCKEHKQTYPEVGEIDISALKVKRQGLFYHLSDFMSMGKAFEGVSPENWFLYVDAARVDKGEPVAADQKEIAIDSKGLVAKKTKKRKMKKSSDGTKSRKKSLIDLNQSALVGELDDLQVVAISETVAVSPRDKLDDFLGGTIVQASDADLLCQEHTRDKVKDVEADQTPKETLEADVGKGDEIAGLVKIDQEKNLAPTLELIDMTKSLEACAQVQVGAAPELCDTLSGEKLDDLPLGAIEKDAPNIPQTGETQLEASISITIGPATEKNNSKDDINQSIDSASRKIVNAIDGVPGNDMDGKSVEDVGRDKIESDNTCLTTHPVSEKKKKQKKRSNDQSLDASTGNKKRKKKSSKDHINHPIVSAATTTTISLETVGNESEKVSDHVDAEN